MSKCLVFVLCAVSLATIVFCGPGSENIREKQSARQDVTDQLNGASRTKRQSPGTVEVVYLDAASLDPTKLRDLQSKESPRLAPVNDVINPGQSYQQIPDSNLELVSQNSDYAVYKLKSAPLNGLPDEKKAQASGDQYYSYDSEQYSGYSSGKDPPPATPGDREQTPRPPPLHHPPPPPPDHYPPPPPDHYPPPPHDHRPPPPYDHRPPPPYGHRPPPPHHHHPPPPPPPDDYRSGYYDRYYDRPPPPPHRREYDDRQTRQSPYDRPPPPHHRGPPPDYGRPPPPHHRGPPPDYGRPPPPHHRGPPPDYGRLTPHRGGPPDRYDDRPPHRNGGPPDRYDDRPPYHHGGPPDRRPPPPRDGPDRFDNRPPSHRPPPPPPHDHRPGQDPNNQGNENNEHAENDNNSGKVIDGTQTSSTTEAETDDDQHQLDIRFADDDQRGAETMKRDVPSKTPDRLISHLSPFIFQAAAVKPED